MTDQPNEQDRHEAPDAATQGARHDEVHASATDPTLTQGEKFTPEKLGDAAIKFATETVYAAAGLANVIAEKAKDLYEAQRKQIADNTPEGVDPNFRKFVDSMPDQFQAFMDDATKAFHDLSDRGRTTMSDFQEQVQTAWKQWEEQQGEKTGAFDLKDAAEATDDAEAAVAPEESAHTGAADATAPAGGAADPVGEYPGEAKGDVRND